MLDRLLAIVTAVGFLLVLTAVLALYGQSRRQGRSMRRWQIGLSVVALVFAMLVVVAASRGEYIASEILPSLRRTFDWLE